MKSNLNCIFWNLSYWRRKFFWFVLCMRNRHSTMIEDYIKRDNVIKCELDSVFTEKLIHCLAFINCCLEERKALINFHKLLSRRRFVKTIIIRSLKRRETARICLWLMILLNRQFSIYRSTRKLNRWILRSFFLWWSEFKYRCAWFVREIENFWSKQ